MLAPWRTPGEEAPVGSVDVVGLGSCTVDFFALVPKLIGAEEKINANRLEVLSSGHLLAPP